jgi:hypothetical protein
MTRLFASLAGLTVLLMAVGVRTAVAQRGEARADTQRPSSFPHRIWAACDFEGRTPDYGWFGRAETSDLPRYAGNTTALAAAPGPYQNLSAVMTGINPVPGPRMGRVNSFSFATASKAERRRRSSTSALLAKTTGTFA